MQSGMNADGQLALERELRAALASGRIIPFYQPVGVGAVEKRQAWLGRTRPVRANR
jgi:hypothetical protein